MKENYVTKPLHSTTVWRRHWVAALPMNRSQANFGLFIGVASVIKYIERGLNISWFEHLNCFSTGIGRKSRVSLYKVNGLYDIAMRYRTGLCSANLGMQLNKSILS